MATIPSTFAQAADLAMDPDQSARAHMAIVRQAMVVTGEDTTNVTVTLATGWAKRQLLADEVMVAAGDIKSTKEGRTPNVIQRVWTATLADWSQSKDLEIEADLLNQIAARWDDVSGVVRADKA